MNLKERRVKFPKGEQRKLILELVLKEGSLKSVSERLGVPYSTMKNYACEDRLLPESLFDTLLNSLSKDRRDLDIHYLEGNWGRILGGKKGMITLESKYPHKIKQWRALARLNSRATNMKKIKIPELNEKLAEFIGAYIGDGTLTNYFIRISGDYRYDLSYFNYLKSLVLDLFGIDAKVFKDNRNVNTGYFLVSSKQLCSFLNSHFGLKYGDKLRNNTLIPSSIMSKRDLSLACLRGLVDTDGCISRRGRNGSQFTVTFFSKNPDLVNQIKMITEKDLLFTFTSKDGYTIGTNKSECILKYFNMVGSSNLRHIVRFNERFNNKNTIYQRQVVDYYQKDLYRNVKLPFKVEYTALSSIG